MAETHSAALHAGIRPSYDLGHRGESVTARGIAIGAIGVIVVVIVLTIAQCAQLDESMRSCTRTILGGLLAYAAHIGAIALGGWAGVETARATRRPWLGWVTALAVMFANSFFLLWLGVHYPDTGIGE